MHDIGYIDIKGYLFIGGRSDDVINVAGHRISSSELESICVTLDNVNEVCAVAVTDKIYGSRVVLYFSSSRNGLRECKGLTKIHLSLLSIFDICLAISFPLIP